MKNLFYLRIFFLILFIYSCRDELTQYSSSKVSVQQALTDVAGFQSVIDTSYNSLKSSSYSVSNSFVYTEILTDNLVLNPEGTNSNSLTYNWNYTPFSTQLGALFTEGYRAISNVNFALKYIDNLKDGAGKTNIIAQARGIRGMVHFDLVRIYSKIPTESADANTSMGIDYRDVFNPQENANGRSLSVSQVYDKIIEDLLFAANNITNSTAEIGRLTKPAILGLLSRVYLYRGDFANAILYGQQCIALSPSVGSRSNFTGVWNSNNTDGVLFKILNTGIENANTGGGYQTGATATGGNIRSEYVAPASLYALFTDNDIRKTAYLRQADYNSKGLRNHIIKWAVNIAGGTNLNAVEIKYLRTAEVYLNVAEAAYKIANESLANQMLNTLKKERYEGYTNSALSGNTLWNEIMLQRRLELAFEADRFFTFKRLGLPMQRTGEGANVDGSGTPAVTQLVTANDYRWLWPIPQSAINKEPDLLPQNPGY